MLKEWGRQGGDSIFISVITWTFWDHSGILTEWGPSQTSSVPTDLVVTGQQQCSVRDSLGTEMGWWFSFSRPELCTLPCKLEVGRWWYVLLPLRGKEVIGTESPVLFLTKLYSSSDKRGSKAGMDWLLTLFSVEEVHAPYQLLTSHIIFLNGTVSRTFSTVIRLSWAVLRHRTGHRHAKCGPLNWLAVRHSPPCLSLLWLATYWDDWWKWVHGCFVVGNDFTNLTSITDPYKDLVRY